MTHLSESLTGPSCSLTFRFVPVQALFQAIVDRPLLPAWQCLPWPEAHHDPQTEAADLGSDTPDYVVGYQRPPIATGFQKGHPGKPKGPLANVIITVSAGQQVQP